MGDKKLPKVLILNQPFNNNTGGGITLSNLFAGWDKDKIAVLCHNFLLENLDTSICDTYYQLGHKEHSFIFPFNFFKRKHYSGLLKFEQTNTYEPEFKRSPLRIKLITQYFKPTLQYLGINDAVAKIELSPDLCKWLDEFKPDIIYGQASERAGLRLISLVQEYTKKPVVFHMMDDWILADEGLFKTIQNKKNTQEFQKLLDKADIALSISESMADEYKARYGKDFTAFHNPIDIDFWKQYQRKNYDLPESPTILYAGRIG